MKYRYYLIVWSRSTNGIRIGFRYHHFVNGRGLQTEELVASVTASAASVSATRTASGLPATTPVDTEPGPKFISSNGEQLSLSGNAGSLGRSDFRSLVQPDEADLISRQHIRFDCEDGECYIEDRNSTNGTKINGSSIDGKGRYLLREGDKVELADILTLTFKS